MTSNDIAGFAYAERTRTGARFAAQHTKSAKCA